MQYIDVPKVSYKMLKSRMENNKPYRGTQAYNLGSRRYSSRHFRMREDGAFTLHNWYLVGAERDINMPKSYTSAVVYPDSSIEYTSGYINPFFLNRLVADISHRKSHGGHVFSGKYMHPLFEGLRIHTETHEAVTPYVLRTKALNKKVANTYIKQFDVSKQVGRKMLEAMDWRGRFEVCRDVLDEYRKLVANESVGLTHDYLVKLFSEGKHADAVAYGVMLSHSGFCYRVGPVYDETYLPRRFNEGFNKAIDRIFKGALDEYILHGSPEVFKYSDAYKMGDVFSSSKWGYLLQDLNGNNLVRI